MTITARDSLVTASPVGVSTAKSPNPLRVPPQDQLVQIPTTSPPLLMVLVDAEEEFDWTSYNRASISVRNIREQIHAQRIMDRFGVVPTYMVDYPVASQAEGIAPLAEFVADGRCRIGAQLHPWVTPPYEEDVTQFTSFANNLPRSLEFRKLKTLTDTITTNYGVRPTIYRAGRYGFGQNTAEALLELEYQIDCSVLPWINLRPRMGPDYSQFGTIPFWLNHSRTLLELPLTVGLVGLLDRLSIASTLYPMVSTPPALRLHIPALLSRLRLLDRIPLTPEGTTIDEARRLTRWLWAKGHRIFCISYHSSSLLVGQTPYVRNAADLTRFLDWLEQYMDFFFDEMKGMAATPDDIRKYGLDQALNNDATL